MALDLNDKTSNGNNLTNNNGATEITTSLPFAQSSKAVQLAAASSQYLSAVDSPSLSITGDLTIEMWLKLTTLPVNNGAFMALCSKGAPANYSWLFALYQAGGVVNFYHEFSSDGSGSTDANSYAWTPSTGVWYHVALVYTAASKTYKIFVDGVQVGSTFTGTRGSIFDSTDPLFIGAYNASSPQLFLNAQIDEVRIWNTPKTSTQLTNSKDAELVGNEANLAAYWPFETQLGTTTSTSTTTTSTSTSTTTTSTSTTTTSTSTSTSTSTTSTSSSTTTTSTSTSTTTTLTSTSTTITTTSTSTTTTSTSTTTTSTSTSTTTSTSTSTTTSTSSSSSTSTTTTYPLGFTIDGEASKQEQLSFSVNAENDTETNFNIDQGDHGGF